MPHSKLKSIILGSTAAMIAVAFALPAQAQVTGVYSGGSTLAEKIYRDTMNCYGNHSGGDTVASLNAPPAICDTATPYNSNVELLYLGVGSGNGRAAIEAHDPSQLIVGGKKGDKPPVASTADLGVFYGAGTGSSWVPASSGPFFPKIHFIGSDDPLAASDVATYTTNNNNAGNSWGAPNQFPGLITTVTIPYTPIGTWNEHGKKPAGGGNSGLVDLSTNTLCGIFTGNITDWSDPLIKADNGGVALSSGGAIFVVYRSDGSGTTFITSNALIHQCAATSFPIPASWQTASGGGKTNVSGIGNDNWFPTVAAAGLLPANFHGQSGSGAVKTTILGQPGAIGYLSPDFALPIDPTGSKAANLQTWVSANAHAAPVWKAATAKNGTAIVGATKAPSFSKNSCPGDGDGICADDPLNWGVLFPTPVSISAYPIGGFTFIATYGCYASAADVSALVGTTAGSLGYLRWYYGSATDNHSLVKTSLTSNGFSEVPGGWVSGIKKLLTTNKPTEILTAGKAGTHCATPGGA